MGILEVLKIVLLIMCCVRSSTSQEDRLLLRKNQISCKVLGAPCIQESDCCGDDMAIAVRCENRSIKRGPRCYKIGRKMCENDHECVSKKCVDRQCLGKHDSNIGLKVYEGDKTEKEDFDDSRRLKVYKSDTIVKTNNDDYNNLRLSLVISHCDEDMSWMKDIFNIPLRDVTIYSKCNSKLDGYFPHNAKIVNMPNIGRCDHSYAHWMSNMEEKDATENHYVLFFKASRAFKPEFSHRSLHRVLQIAMQHGFACETELKGVSSYHNTEKLLEFSIEGYKDDMIKSKYRNMGEWLNDLEIELPILTPVCYTGNFVAKATQIYSQRHIFSKIEESLTRGDSIEEGHFAERAWAGLLSYPMSADEKEIFDSIDDLKMHSDRGIRGVLSSHKLTKIEVSNE